MPGPRDYTRTTRTALAALSKGTCYFPGCSRPVVTFIDGEPYVDVQIAHIYDANVGNRFRSAMTDEERRAFSNLILLCKPHHDLVDKRHPGRYRPEDLQAWKAEREGDVVIDDPTAVSEGALEEALTQVTIIHVEEGGLHLGGAGGNAPGAGGGGGGVIGSGTGGPGGPGGATYIRDETVIDLDGGPGITPGGGGGGAGLLDDGVLVRRPRPGEGREGCGYSDGVDGQDGGTSSFGDPGSEVFVEAPGGKGGLAGGGPRLTSEALGLSLLTLVSSVEVRQGFLYILSGGWQSFSVQNLGDRFTLAAVLVFEAGGLDVGDYTASVSVEDPSGTSMAIVSFPVCVEEAGDVLRIPRIVTFALDASSFGLWRVSVRSDVRTLGSIDLMIKRSGVATVHPSET